MPSNRIRIWTFADAPKALRSLHCGSQPQDWLAFVPRSVWTTDLDDVILGREPERTSRYEAPKGNFIYTGTSPLPSVPVQPSWPLPDREAAVTMVGIPVKHPR